MSTASTTVDLCRNITLLDAILFLAGLKVTMKKHDFENYIKIIKKFAASIQVVMKNKRLPTKYQHVMI